MRRALGLACAVLFLWLASTAAADPQAAPTPSPVAAPPAAGAELEGPPRFGVSIDRSQPLSITSDALEAFKAEGRRRLVFTDNVEVRQADVTIRTDRLEAFYAPEANQPQRLIATGSVVVRQGEREARCQRASYDRETDRLVCSGEARLIDGEDAVRGEMIEFDLARETVVVTGGAAVVLHPRPQDNPDNPEGDEVP